MNLYPFLFESEGEDYRGEHMAPDKSDSPLYDLTVNGTYPEDFYSEDGVRFYSDGSPEEGYLIGMVQRLRGKRKARIKVYRAVPRMPSLQDQVDELEAHMKYILKHGKVPRGVETRLGKSDYYNWAHDEVEKLQAKIAAGQDQSSKIETINSGDWVTISRPYAVEHGKSNLKGKYKILSKTVTADQLFTDGNSFVEWGYSP